MDFVSMAANDAAASVSAAHHKRELHSNGFRSRGERSARVCKDVGHPPKPRPLEAGSEEQNKPHPDLPLREAVPPKETGAPPPSVDRLPETPRLALWPNSTGQPVELRTIRSSLAGFRKKDAECLTGRDVTTAVQGILFLTYGLIGYY